jgi:hypothetical protein
VTEEFRGAGPETLAPYDVVIINYFERGQLQLRWGERADNALLEFVRSGKGLVGYHFSLAAFNGWSEYEKCRPATGGRAMVTTPPATTSPWTLRTPITR